LPPQLVFNMAFEPYNSLYLHHYIKLKSFLNAD
jgi:hypothetical protein